MKKKMVLFLIVFSISLIFTYPAFPTSHALDSYCTMCNGYSKTAVWFLQNGRVFSYLLFKLFGILKMPYNSIGFVSTFLGNAMLSLCVVLFYVEIKKKIKFKDNLYNYLLIILLFLLYFNPLYNSILVLDEAFVIDLGILFLTIASIYLLKDGMKNYFISLFLTVIGVMCYQGIASYMFVTLFILLLFYKDNKIKFYIKNIFLSIVNYGIAFVCNYFIIKLVSSLLGKAMPKIGKFNIFDNISKIYNNFIPNTFKYMFNYVNVKYYYLLVIVSLIIVILFIIKNNNRIKNIIILLFILFSCFFIPFVPNIFMNSTSNYTDARMVLTAGIIPVVLVLYVLLNFKIERKIFYSLCGISFCIFLLFFYSIHQNMMIDLKRYKNDMGYVSNVISNIDFYESKNKKVVKTIYYHSDSDSAYYYSFGHANGVNIRLMAVDWAFECAFNVSTNHKYVLKKMSDKKYRELFKDREYDEFDEEQLIYDEDKLYLLIF